MSLIVCRRVDEIDLLPQITRVGRHVVASDDLRVHRAAASMPRVEHTRWIEEPESYFGVAEQVSDVIGALSRWVESVAAGAGVAPELVAWVRHCEGGMTSQRVQDLLMLVRADQRLFDATGVADLIVVASPGWEWEDEVLIATAKSRGIAARRIGGRRPRAMLARVWRLVRPLVREAYWAAHALATKWRDPAPPAGHRRLVLVQRCDSSHKHVASVTPLMQAFAARGYDPVAVCWRAAPAARRFRELGLDAVNLERWVTVRDVVAGWWKLWRCWRSLRARRPQLVELRELEYQRVRLETLLWESVRWSIFAELGGRYRLQRAATRYAAPLEPAAIHFWTTIFPEAMILSRCFPNLDRSVVFYIPGFPYSLPNPYRHHSVPIDVVLAAGEDHHRSLLQEGWAPEKIRRTGSALGVEIVEFGERYSRAASRAHLGLPQESKLYVFYDPNMILRGYLSPAEQARTTDALLAFARTNPGVVLIVKPHPGHKSGILELQIAEARASNVVLVPAKDPVHHCLNAADVVVTKFSTVGVQAMFLKRPVVSVLLDGEKSFQIFGEAAEYAWSLAGLKEVLARLVSDEGYRRTWERRLLRAGEDYLRRTFDQTQRPGDLVVDAVDEFVTARVR